jgi:5'-nucleotidase
MRILITNDDGIHAEGIKALTRVAKSLPNAEVIVVAPDREKSACGHGMTLHEPLRVKETTVEGCPGYMVNGLPVDCVNVGLTTVFSDHTCDLVLSGINNGPNLGFDITYSGTVAGAMEGCINGIPSIGISMASFVQDAPLHFETGERWLLENIQKIIGIPAKPGTFLNLNIPAIAYEEIKGIQVATMGKRVYEDRVERRDDPWGRPYYWQGGVVIMRPEEPGTDVYAVANHFVSLTPITLDWTDLNFADSLKSMLNDTGI